MMKWEESLGENVEVFFPTRREEGMSEEDFEALRLKNLERGRVVGTRRGTSVNINPTEERSNEWEPNEKEKAQLRMIALQEKIKSMETELRNKSSALENARRATVEDSSKKNEEIVELKQKMRYQSDKTAEERMELQDELKYVQEERVEASRQAEFLRNKVSSLEKKLKDALNNKLDINNPEDAPAQAQAPPSSLGDSNKRKVSEGDEERNTRVKTDGITNGNKDINSTMEDADNLIHAVESEPDGETTPNNHEDDGNANRTDEPILNDAMDVDTVEKADHTAVPSTNQGEQENEQARTDVFEGSAHDSLGPDVSAPAVEHNSGGGSKGPDGQGEEDGKEGEGASEPFFDNSLGSDFSPLSAVNNDEGIPRTANAQADGAEVEEEVSEPLFDNSLGSGFSEEGANAEQRQQELEENPNTNPTENNPLSPNGNNFDPSLLDSDSNDLPTPGQRNFQEPTAEDDQVRSTPVHSPGFFDFLDSNLNL